jgi:hypothetical protein
VINVTISRASVFARHEVADLLAVTKDDDPVVTWSTCCMLWLMKSTAIPRSTASARTETPASTAALPGRRGLVEHHDVAPQVIARATAINWR